jgi:hypothetical protein
MKNFLIFVLSCFVLYVRILKGIPNFAMYCFLSFLVFPKIARYFGDYFGHFPGWIYILIGIIFTTLITLRCRGQFSSGGYGVNVGD